MSVTSKQKLFAKLRNKEYRDAYVAEHVKTSVPIQARTLRDQQGLTQTELARRAEMKQTVISRLEDPNYGNLTINSLLKLASGLDVALLVKFVPYSRLLDEFKDVSPKAIAAKSFTEEIDNLETWASEEPTPVTRSTYDATNVMREIFNSRNSTAATLTDADAVETGNLNRLTTTVESEIKGQLEFSFKALHAVPDARPQNVRLASITPARQQPKK